MSGIYKNNNLKYWRNYLGFSAEEFNLIKKEFIKINLKTGEYLYDFNQLPNGIILINEGTLRLVGKNTNNELISIEKFSKNEIASAITILCGKKNTSLIASSDVRGFFLKKELFF